MSILRPPTDLSDWHSNTQGDLISAHKELVKVIPGLHPSSGANLATVELLSKEAPHLDPLTDFFEPSNPWEDTLNELRSAQRDLVARHWIERNIVTGPLDAMIYGLSLVPRATPLEGTAIYATSKLLEGQRAILEWGVLRRQAEKRAALARHAMRKLMTEENQPYGALFPVGDPQQTRDNIQRAQELLRSELSDLDPDMRNEVLHGMLDAMTSLVDANPPSATGEGPEGLDEPFDLEAAKKDAKEAQLATKGAKVILEQKKKDMQVSADVSATLEKILLRLDAQGNLRPSEAQKLKELGKSITAATGAAQSVIAAAEALGLPSDTAADLNKAVAIVSNAAMLYVGFKTNPAQAITAGANLIALFAGRKRKDPAAARHKAVMNALNDIFRQNQQIMENQRIIVKSLDRLSESVYAIQRNQVALFELGLTTLDAVLLNRGLIVRTTTGPLALLEEAVIEFDGMHRSDGLTYSTLTTFFSGYTGDVARGLRSLRSVLRSTSDVHPALLQATYRDGTRAEIRTEGRVNYLEVGSSAAVKLRDEDERRYALCRAAWLRGGKRRDPRILTEFGTYCSVYDTTSLGELNLGLKHTWDGTLPPSLLEIGLVWKFGTLALQTHHFHQFLSELTGAPALRSLKDIQDLPAENDLGQRLLEKALAHVDCALAQSYLMTGRFASLDYLSGLWTGKVDEASRIMIELDAHAPPPNWVYSGAVLSTHVAALWTTIVENGDIRVETGWIDSMPDILPKFSDTEAVLEAVDNMHDLQNSIDGFMYTLSHEDSELVDEYFEATEQAEAAKQPYVSEYFRNFEHFSCEFSYNYDRLEFNAKRIETPVTELPGDVRAIAEGIGGLIQDGQLVLEHELIITGETALFDKRGVVELAQNFAIMGQARKLGVDHPSLAEKLPNAMRDLSLYDSLNEDAFRGGTEELKALRAALIAALAEYDVSDKVAEARQTLNVAVALSSLDLEIEPIEVL